MCGVCHLDSNGWANPEDGGGGAPTAQGYTPTSRKSVYLRETWWRKNFNTTPVPQTWTLLGIKKVRLFYHEDKESEPNFFFFVFFLFKKVVLNEVFAKEDSFFFSSSMGSAWLRVLTTQCFCQLKRNATAGTLTLTWDSRNFFFFFPFAKEILFSSAIDVLINFNKTNGHKRKKTTILNSGCNWALQNINNQSYSMLQDWAQWKPSFIIKF